MNAMARGRTAATVIGIGAVVVAIAGSAVAVPSVRAAINGQSIANHTITGNKLKNDTLTGKQIKESTLKGLNATKLGGTPASGFVRTSRQFHFAFTMTKGQADRKLTFGPLKFTAHCGTVSTNTIAEIDMKVTKPVVAEVGMSPLGALTPSSPAQFVTKDQGPDAAYDSQPVFAYTGDGTFVVGPESRMDAVINPPGSDCAFLGSLTNIGK